MYLISKLYLSGVDYHFFFNAYYELINKELSPSKDQPFWYQTRLNKATGMQYFHTQPMGINCCYKIPRFMADTLGLKNAFEFTGHSFRRSALTHLADKDAAPDRLRNKANHSSLKGNF